MVYNSDQGETPKSMLLCGANAVPTDKRNGYLVDEGRELLLKKCAAERCELALEGFSGARRHFQV